MDISIVFSGLYSYYIKYDILGELSLGLENDINIYVDIYRMLQVYRFNYNEIPKRDFIIPSFIINLAGHYRNFYRKMGINCKIYLVYADGSNSNHKIFIPSFNSHKDELRLNYENNKKYINEQLELVKILAAYINDVYFIRRTSEFSVVVNDIINMHNSPVNIALTRSKYVYQLSAMNKNTYMFIPKMLTENTHGISKSNALIRYYQSTKSKTALSRMANMSSELMSVFFALNGCSDKNVHAIINIDKVSRVIQEAIEKNLILNGYNADFRSVYNALPDIHKNIDPTTFEYRFKGVDLYYQTMIYKTSMESKDMSWNINLNDPNTIRQINNKYFTKYPIILENL